MKTLVPAIHSRKEARGRGEKKKKKKPRRAHPLSSPLCPTARRPTLTDAHALCVCPGAWAAGPGGGGQPGCPGRPGQGPNGRHCFFCTCCGLDLAPGRCFLQRCWWWGRGLARLVAPPRASIPCRRSRLFHGVDRSYCGSTSTRWGHTTLTSAPSTSPPGLCPRRRRGRPGRLRCGRPGRPHPGPHDPGACPGTIGGWCGGQAR